MKFESLYKIKKGVVFESNCTKARIFSTLKNLFFYFSPHKRWFKEKNNKNIYPGSQGFLGQQMIFYLLEILTAAICASIYVSHCVITHQLIEQQQQQQLKSAAQPRDVIRWNENLMDSMLTRCSQETLE